MPEKPKRRKNNKNKRKNKNNRSDNNKSSSSDVKDTQDTVGSGSVQSLVSLEKNYETSCLPIETESIDLELPIPNNVSCGISNKEDECNLEVLHQDLNNNSESIISTSNPVKNEDADASTALVSTCDPDYTKEVINDELSAVFTGDPDVLKENIDAKLSVVSVCEPVITKENTDANLSVLSTCDTATTKEHTNTKSSIDSDCGHVTKITDNAALTSETYIVESPDHSKKHKSKLNAKVKSKSLDNDEETKIVEITDESDKQCEHENTIEILDSSILVTDVESDIEWEKIEDSALEAQELATGTLSVTTIPLNTPQCELTKSLTPDQEMSLRHYLQTLNLSTNPNINTLEIKTEIEQIINREIRHRLRKKGLADDFIPTRLGIPRILDVIDEEGSSESSLTSRRHSYLSDKKSDNEDLEDDVFEAKPKVSPNLKCNLTGKNIKSIGRLVPQECVLVGAKLKEPELAEARGDWIMQTVEQMKGAEFVYLTDSSSSTSSIHELVEESDNGDETDVSVRIITPTIEVTDTDNLLKNNFILDNKEKMQENIETKITSDNSVCAHEVEKSFIDTSNENRHEIVVSSIDDIKTNLYVKDIENLEIDETTNIPKLNRFQKDNINAKKNSDDYDLEMKVLKCELNDAINNLIKEVCSDSEQNEIHKNDFVRQDSSSSISSSQCTAKYNPTYSSLNDVSNTHDETNNGSLLATETTQELGNNGHVKDVFECVTGQSTHRQSESIHPPALRDICVEKIASLPYGDKILEELASVSERLQKINNIGVKSDRRASKEETNNMPYYPLPDLSTIEKVSLPVQQKDPLPPPVQPRNSSLKKSQDDHWTAMPTKVEPVYICLSPSQKMLMEKTNTIISKDGATQLVDMHKKYVDRRGYNEPKIEGNRIKNEANEDPPIVPFKSQTGSRLLALIRDPAVTSTINSSVNNRYYNAEQARKDYSDSELISKLKNDKRTFSEFTGTFKPIPPPRPKKYSSSYYESDESSDFTDTSLRSFRSEKKVFHYSTGNLSKDIEDDISSIQNMHRYYTNIRDNGIDYNKPRRPSLPKDICDQQMEYIRQKEKEVEAEIKRLEQEKVNVSSHKKGPRAPLISEKETVTQNENFDNFPVLKLRDNALKTQSTERTNKSKLSSIFSSSQEELLRDKMYSEYVSQMAERQERKQHKVIKITNPSQTNNSKSVSKSMSALDVLDSKVNNRIEKEFVSKARERWNKLGIADPETEDEREKDKDVYREPKVIEHKIKVIEAGQERDVKKLPTHLQEFVSFTAKQKERGSGSSGESGSGSASPHVVIWCAVMILVLAVGKYFLRLLRNK